jgi:hypothetical protein
VLSTRIAGLTPLDIISEKSPASIILGNKTPPAVASTVNAETTARTPTMPEVIARPEYFRRNSAVPSRSRSNA